MSCTGCISGEKLEFCPGPPKYLPKDGRFKLAFPRAHLTIRNGAVTLGMSHTFRKQHGLTGKELTFPIPACIKPHQIREVTILPVHDGKTYMIEFSYAVPATPADPDPDQYLAIDLGLTNFATIVESATGTATILDGSYLKSINRWYKQGECTVAGHQGPTGNEGDHETAGPSPHQAG